MSHDLPHKIRWSKPVGEHYNRPEAKQKKFDPKPRFLGNKFSMIRNSIGGGTNQKSEPPADNLLATAPHSQQNGSRIPSLPIFARDDTVWGLANVG